MVRDKSQAEESPTIDKLCAFIEKHLYNRYTTTFILKLYMTQSTIGRDWNNTLIHIANVSCVHLQLQLFYTSICNEYSRSLLSAALLRAWNHFLSNPLLLSTPSHRQPGLMP